jgi:hypothetical protein
MKSIEEDARDVCEKYRHIIDHLYESSGADSNAARDIKIFAGELDE